MPALSAPLRRLPLALLACGLVLLPAAAVRAQSLTELYEAARSYDAGYLSTKARTESVKYLVEQAESSQRPKVNLEAGGNSALVVPPQGGSGDSNSLSVGIGGRWPLINKANDATIAQARRRLESAQASLDAAEQDLIVRLAQAYFDVLAAQDSLATTQANKTAIAEQLASAKRNFEVGTATITDAREAQARYDIASSQEISAENELQIRRSVLDQLVGRPGVAPLRLAAPVTLPPVLPASLDVWTSAADQYSPAVRAARVELDVALLETTRARAAESYTVDAIGSVGSSRASGRYAATLSGFSTRASVGVEFAMPLYTGGATQSAIKEKLVLEEKARQDLEAARRGATQSTREAFLRVQSGIANARALEAAESSSKLALESTQLGYKVGVRVNLDVLNAQFQVFQTQRDLARVRYDVLVGSLRLRQATGQLSASDLNAVNALLAR